MPSFRSSSGKKNPESPAPSVEKASPRKAVQPKPGTRTRPPLAKPKKPTPAQVYRVEGLGRHGSIRYVKVIGNPGMWKIVGVGGMTIEVTGRTVAEAVKKAGRKIPFRPIVIRQIEIESK